MGALSAAGHTGILFALRRNATAIVGTAHPSQMVWAIIFATLVFHEPTDRLGVIGMAAIVLSGCKVLSGAIASRP